MSNSKATNAVITRDAVKYPAYLDEEGVPLNGQFAQSILTITAAQAIPPNYSLVLLGAGGTAVTLPADLTNYIGQKITVVAASGVSTITANAATTVTGVVGASGVVSGANKVIGLTLIGDSCDIYFASATQIYVTGTHGLTFA